MNRTQKKCVIAATGMHLLLVVIMFVGPAFLSSHSRVDDMPVLDFVPAKTIDQAFSGGGNPNAQPPPPAPKPQPQVTPPAPQPQPQPQPPKVEKVEPPKVEKADLLKEVVRPAKPDPDAVEKASDKSRKPDVSTKLVTRPKNASRQATTSDSDSDSQARADAKRQSQQFSSAARRLREGLSSTTTIDMPGPGGGGVSYANFLQVVKSIYAQAWVVPDGVTDDEATTAASVTIAKDGTVISARIIRSSGNSEVDKSVQAVLDRVRYAAPLPDDAKEEQRTVTIKFNVKARKLLG